MIQNYSKITWRNLIDHKLYSCITIMGLFIGLMVALFIGSYVWGKLRINKNFKNWERQCQLLSQWKDSIMELNFTTFDPLFKRLKEEHPSLVANYYQRV